jgi:hypothetical protein
MSDGVKCQCAIDCAGLHEIARMTGNLKAVFLDHLSTGLIGVPACVWQEFQDIYEDDAPEIGPHIAVKINMKKTYHVGAASIADKMNSRFTLGPYDRQADLYTASICSIEKYTLLTSKIQIADYQKMNCCAVSELIEWATEYALS